MDRSQWEASTFKTLADDLYQGEREKHLQSTVSGETYHPPTTEDLLKTLMAQERKKELVQAEPKKNPLQQHGIFGARATESKPKPPAPKSSPGRP